jgi:hypothetical protein
LVNGDVINTTLPEITSTCNDNIKNDRRELLGSYQAAAAAAFIFAT